MERGKPGDILKECDADLAALVSLLFLFFPLMKMCVTAVFTERGISPEISLLITADAGEASLRLSAAITVKANYFHLESQLKQQRLCSRGEQ